MQFRFGVMIVFLLTVIGCGSDENLTSSPTPFVFPNIIYFPKNLNIPTDNPITKEGAALGRYLFYDGRLSGRTHPDSLMSCATCHTQNKGFDIGTDHPKFGNSQPVGLSGKSTPHFPLPLVNLAYNKNGYGWNGNVNEENNALGYAPYGLENDPNFHHKNIETFVWMAIVAPHEMNGNIEKTVNTIANIPYYAPMFEAAFGDQEVTFERISKAIGQFVRTIISNNSKYHQYIEGKTKLTESESRGMELFFSEKADCFHCHGAYLMTTNEFFNNAKDSVFDDPLDRFNVTGDIMDKGAYKAPSLINCEVTGPYMHDGRFNTLEEVVDFYSEGLVASGFAHPLMKNIKQGGVHLTKQEKEDLLAFLKALTDHDLLSNPAYAKPADLEY